MMLDRKTKHTVPPQLQSPLRKSPNTLYRHPRRRMRGTVLIIFPAVPPETRLASGLGMNKRDLFLGD